MFLRSKNSNLLPAKSYFFFNDRKSKMAANFSQKERTCSCFHQFLSKIFFPKANFIFLRSKNENMASPKYNYLSKISENPRWPPIFTKKTFADYKQLLVIITKLFHIFLKLITFFFCFPGDVTLYNFQM